MNTIDEKVSKSNRIKHLATIGLNKGAKFIGAHLPSYAALFLATGDPELSLKLHLGSVAARWTYRAYRLERNMLENAGADANYGASFLLTMPERGGYLLADFLTHPTTEP